MHHPAFPAQWQPLVDQAATTLRALALDERAKEKFCNDPQLRPYMHKVSQRYVAGRTVADALRRVEHIIAQGHAASAEYMGESVRDEGFAMAETEVFMELTRAIGQRNLNCSVSFDLSHVGLTVDKELGYRNARRIALAAAEINREAMISMEGADRADDIYAIYARLHKEDGLHNVGITVPAKRHRTAQDLPSLMKLPGRIRLVKGAFLEPEAISYHRNSPELAEAYRRHARELLLSGHKCSIATHDRGIQQELSALILEERIDPRWFEFESLIGLGTEQIAELHARGFPTREYAVFGDEHFLYVLNRIAEEPVRVYQAIIDVMQDWGQV
ncbi:proline dehydrogenase [Duganella sp. BJB488]|uniref:proline dehydrogenase family protein n=1 Tax=unclassified Duganella TaxID=2636909 RepID=UPI000E34F672|nr:MULTISPECIES: proline dehydrogenase family protein [unclassified Duganella]RFP09763.1 proline dehydrogenase [Duganella sp. BJB489]RFP13376.1 proline dehydrogenase [Duganella sp. BJB488]RFP29330.1 proline dehydrogenase [Duganella sp. BJB480]